MGATCKFREKEKDIHSQDPLTSFQNQSSDSESQLNFKNKTQTRSKKSRKLINTPLAMESPHFFIIYPKNENQRNDLILQLQELNRNNNYFIEEYSQIDSQSIESQYESYFSLDGLSEGSFNVFRI